MKHILFISGSLRKNGSINTALLRAFESYLPKEWTPLWATISLPLFNEELENNFPREAENFRQNILKADAIIIASPEYNRGVSGVLKNAIDWASRPYGKNAWEGKKVLVVSASPGGIGGALALYQVKQSLLHLGADVLGHPEFIVGNAYEKFKDDVLCDEKTKEKIKEALSKLLSSF
jgi:chromate reductase, NAD(P)H dehydrogenase (quinone)